MYKELYQHCPIELGAITEILYICFIQYGSHELHATIEHLKIGTSITKELNKLILFNFNVNSHVCHIE